MQRFKFPRPTAYRTLDALVTSIPAGRHSLKEKKVVKQDKLFAGDEQHSAGGKTLIRVPAGIESRAKFDGPRQEYRYMLHRRWAEGKTCMFVMMNPSTATVEFDDPSVAKCRRYAMAWGYGAMYVGNTFGYRATDQKQLMEVDDPNGPGNDAWLVKMAKESDLIVFAYGKPHKALRGRGPEVAKMIVEQTGKDVHVLKLCADGTPSHPLYLKGDLRPAVWKV